MFEFLQPEHLVESAIALLALTAMEIVLGIDNIVFIAIVTGRLPLDQRSKARSLGIGLALGFRILLLVSLYYVSRIEHVLWTWPTDVAWVNALFDWFSHGDIGHKKEVEAVTIKDLILFVGGLFLIWKSVHEIHKKIEGDDGEHKVSAKVGMASALVQIALLDIIFSLDSVITAVGMADQIPVMVIAVVVAVIVMLIFSGRVSAFVERHPTVKMLALSFLILIGVMLVAESIGTPISKGYIYFAMAFALIVELLNIRMRSNDGAAKTGKEHAEPKRQDAG